MSEAFDGKRNVRGKCNSEHSGGAESAPNTPGHCGLLSTPELSVWTHQSSVKTHRRGSLPSAALNWDVERILWQKKVSFRFSGTPLAACSVKADQLVLRSNSTKLYDFSNRKMSPSWTSQQSSSAHHRNLAYKPLATPNTKTRASALRWSIKCEYAHFGLP
jgi:hypothetical protein